MSISEQARTRAPQRRERQKPVFIARAKVNGGWQTIGAAWNFRSGEPGLSVQLNTLPINFDGRFVLLEPLAEGQGDPEPSEEPARRGKPDDEIAF